MLLVLASAAQAASLTAWDVDVVINDDGTSEWSVNLAYNGTVTSDDYWLFAKARDARVLVDGKDADCDMLTPELGTSIVCKDILGSNINYIIHTENVINKFNTFHMFFQTISLTRFTDSFTMKVRLPQGAALAEPSELRQTQTGLSPFEPAFGKLGTDGRGIFVSWELTAPKIGETLPARLVYKPLITAIDQALSTEVMIVLIIAAVVVFFMLLWRLRMRAEHLLPVLVGGERVVMAMLLKNKTMDQRDIVRATDFSKAKVSRIVKVLGERGLVDVEPKGRTKKITLSMGKKEKKAKGQSEDKKGLVKF